MSFVENFIDNIGLYVGAYTSSISALFLSVYNWYKAREGAIIELTESYRFGIYTYQSGRKLFYFPLDIMNNGNKNGTINDIYYEITGPDGNTVTLYPKRKVETGSAPKDKMSPKELREILPILPVFCAPMEGQSVLFEYYEDVDETKIIKKDIKYRGKINIRYNGKKNTSLDFSFTITEDAWNKSGFSIYWIRFN